MNLRGTCEYHVEQNIDSRIVSFSIPLEATDFLRPHSFPSTNYFDQFWEEFKYEKKFQILATSSSPEKYSEQLYEKTNLQTINSQVSNPLHCCARVLQYETVLCLVKCTLSVPYVSFVIRTKDLAFSEVILHSLQKVFQNSKT